MRDLVNKIILLISLKLKKNFIYVNNEPSLLLFLIVK